MYWKGKHIFNRIEVAPGGAAYGFGNYNTLGKTWFVNNITGVSTNDGETWDRAFAEVSQAITAVNAELALKTAGIYDYNVGTIVVQGTITAYTGVTTLPQFCDIIGIGTSPRGHVSGVPRLGADTGAYDGVLNTGGNSTRCNWYNMQFQAGAAKSAFSCENIFAAHFENCAFMVNGTASTAATNGFTVSGLAHGVTMNECFWGTNSNKDFTKGFYITGTHWHNCLVSNCHIVGKTAAILVDAGCVRGDGSEFLGCYIGSGYEDSTSCIDDNTVVAQIIFRNCGFSNTPKFADTSRLRCIACTVAGTADFDDTGEA